MPESVTLEEVLNLAQQLSPLDKIRLIEQITPHLKRDFIVSPSQPRKSLSGIWKDLNISEEEIAEVKAEMNSSFPPEEI